MTATNQITTGAMWNRYYADKQAWPDGAYHDDTVVKINGKHNQDADLANVSDHALVEIANGYVMLPDGKDIDLGEHFAAWLKAQTVVSGVFEAPLELLEVVKAAIVAAGGKVISQ